MHRFRAIVGVCVAFAVLACPMPGIGADSQPAQPKVLGMFWRKSPLQRVLIQGRDPSVDLADLLRKLDETPVKTKEEAQAICELLKLLPEKDAAQKPFSSRLHALTALFQDVETKEAFAVLAKEGCPELCRIVDQLADTKDERTADDVVMVLKVLAMYRTEAGTDRVIRAARKSFRPDVYWWHVVLAQYDQDHPLAKRVYKELSNPLPQGFLAVALLDSANNFAINGGDAPHPFNSADGIKRLQSWLTSREEDEYSYAHSATAAIPFIRKPERDQLLALALDHPQVEVQLEGAWASAKLGSEAGIKVLARYCLDCNHSERAREYLTELKREDAIPRESLAPDFRAKAEFANWLAHPNELGRAPDEIQIVDHRTLAWPPEGKRIPLWLIKYRVRDTTGLENDDVDCGLVGSVTFCLFSYRLAERPPEDAYAIHCYWEMEGQKLIREVAVEQGDKRYEAMLQQWRGEPLKNLELLTVAELSPNLKYPQNAVALATATLKEEDGWLVLDGPRSAWYPKRDMPADTPDSIVLNIHVGRKLLGFEGQPDRQKYLSKAPPKRDPRQIIQAYERLLTEASTGNAKRKKSLLGLGSPLEKHFDAFVEAQVSVKGTPNAEVVIRTYETLLAAARSADESVRKEALDGFGPLAEHFQRYVDALAASGRRAQVAPLIEELAPYWDHNLGYGMLGTAAFRVEQYEIAERYLTKLRKGRDDPPHDETMDLLAEVWHKKGQTENAHSLLVDCLKGVLGESRTATGSDRKRYEDWFQNHRSTYLRLFPDRGDAELKKNGIPATTRPCP